MNQEFHRATGEEEEEAIEAIWVGIWARENYPKWFEPRWSKARILAFWVAVLMALGSCWIGWLEITK